MTTNTMISDVNSIRIENLRTRNSTPELASALLSVASILISLQATSTIRSLREADLFSYQDASENFKILGKKLVAELNSVNDIERSVLSIMNLSDLASEEYWQKLNTSSHPLTETSRRELVSLHSRIVFTTTHLPRLARLLVQVRTPTAIEQDSPASSPPTLQKASTSGTRNKPSLNSWLIACIGLLLIILLDTHWQTLQNLIQSNTAQRFATHSILLGGVFAYLLGGLIKGTAGIGMALVAVPTMALLTDPKIAVALVAFPLIFTNIWQALRDRSILETCRSYWRLSISMTLVMTVTALLAKNAPPSLIAIVLGSIAIVFALINLGMKVPALPEKYDNHGQWVAGTLAGLIGGVSGLVVIPLVAYMLMRRPEKNQFVSVLGFLFLISGIVLACTQWNTGVFTTELIGYSLLLVVPGMLGILVGEKIRSHINEDAFKKIVLVIIMLIGGNLVASSLLG